MGTWAIPRTIEEAKKLQKLVAKPVSPKIAKDKLYSLLGDDDLLDLIEAEKEKFGNNCDVRILIGASLREFVNGKEEDAMGPWDEEAIEICKNICKSIDELYIPY